jgi:hypothetical protein
MDTNPFDYIYTGKWVVMGRTYMKDTVFSEREASSAEFNESRAAVCEARVERGLLLHLVDGDN